MAVTVSKFEMRFHPGAPAAVIQKVIQETLEVVTIAFDAVRNVDLSVPLPDTTERFGLRFSGDPRPHDERKLSYSNWLLAKGFQELARGIRSGLEEALVHIGIVDRIRSGKATASWGDFQLAMSGFRKQANDLNFPSLMKRVNRGLREPLQFEQEFIAFNKVRNCLEHRNGVIGELDVDKKTSLLELTLPRMKVFYIRKGEEVEIFRGSTIEGEDGKGAQVNMRMVPETRVFKLGERVVFTEQQFADVGWGCFAFANDLRLKMPAP